MDISLDWPAIARATLSTMVAGTVWYRPAVVLAAAADVTGRDLELDPLPAALLAAAVLWLGFTAARMLVHDLFASRDLRIWLIDAAYELATALAMAVVIGLLG